MKRWLPPKHFLLKIVALIFCLVVQSDLHRAAVLGAPRSEIPSPDSQAEYVPGEIILKLESGKMAFRDAAQTLAGQQVITAIPVPELGVWRVKVDVGRELEQLQELRSALGVEYAEFNHIAYAQETPNDPFYGSQWGLDKINAPAGWDVTHGSQSVIIAVVDTGIDGTHPDLSSKVIAGANYVTSATCAAQSNCDDNGHGTHVAGIASAITNNGAGVAGTAWQASLMPVKVLNSGGSGSYTNVALGIKYAADNGARIISLSLGGSDDDYTLSQQIDYAYSKGCLIVAAAGNGDTTPLLYPARYANVMAVGNTTSDDQRNSSSNYGAGLSVMAPGTSIYSTLAGGGYGYKTGTSMSTPFVSGLAALVWTVIDNATNDQVRQIIEENALDLGDPGWDQYYGFGRIDAAATLAPLVSVTLSPSSVSFLADDESDPTPISVDLILQAMNQEAGIITWTTTISPEVTDWLTVAPALGTLSGQETSIMTIEANKNGLAYGAHHSELIVHGFNGSITMTTAADITLYYVPELTRIILVPIFKGYAFNN